MAFRLKGHLKNQGPKGEKKGSNKVNEHKAGQRLGRHFLMVWLLFESFWGHSDYHFHSFSELCWVLGLDHPGAYGGSGTFTSFGIVLEHSGVHFQCFSELWEVLGPSWG